MVSIMDFESIYLGSNPSMTLCQLGRVVKATDLKSVGATFVGSSPTADVLICPDSVVVSISQQE